jgi:hypothetical protein
MKKLLNPIDLKNILSAKYTHFADEEGRIVEIDKFLTLFVYKYTSSLCSWFFYIQKDCLHCGNISGFKYVFPLVK